MQSLACILLLVERGPDPHGALNKALLLARHFGARLELLLCETRCPTAMWTDSAAERARAGYIIEGERYLQALRQTIISPGVDVGTEVMCAPSLAYGLAEKLRRGSVQLVVKSAQVAPGRIGPRTWQLSARCSAPLLLTAGRPWRARPRFAAVLDLSERAHCAAGSQIVALSEMLAGHCGAELDYLCAASVPGEAGQVAEDAHRRLCELLPVGMSPLGRMQYCSGEAAGVLPPLIAGGDYDLLAVGAISSHSREAHGVLTAALLEESAGDVLLVPAGMDGDNVGASQAAAIAE